MQIIQINESLRLRTFSNEEYKTALPWYEDPQILWYSENVKEGKYDMAMINRMYDFLKSKGTLYYIEILEDSWIAIGDVTLSREMMPIVILPKYWHRGIGKLVINTLLAEAVRQGYKTIRLSGIYHYNQRSQGLFTQCGFSITHRDDRKIYMEKVLNENI